MARMIHDLLCTVSRRYRVSHCDGVDDLPPRYSRKLREECSELDARSWSNAEDMMRDVLAENVTEELDERTNDMGELLSGEGFRIVIHKAQEGGYWGEVPALPGCASFGDTREKCRANVLEAAKGCFECYVGMAMRKLASGVRRPAPPVPQKSGRASIRTRAASAFAR